MGYLLVYWTLIAKAVDAEKHAYEDVPDDDSYEEQNELPGK